jgi:cystinosin
MRSQILNYRVKSTLGLAPEFSLLNVLGFVAYTLTSSFFLFSDNIRAQYAYRHPAAPQPTVRFNDFVFAVHALLLCAITYSQFFPKLWGFTVGIRQRSSRAVLGIVYGSVVAVATVILLVRVRGRDGGNDASRIAWIDVVSVCSFRFFSAPPFMKRKPCMTWLAACSIANDSRSIRLRISSSLLRL